MTRNLALLGSFVLMLAPMTSIAADHVAMSPDHMKWGAAPPAFPKGAQISVLSGDPTKEGPYVLRLKAPAGYKVPPHTHPADENVTVISGTFVIGTGAKLEENKGTPLKAGGFMHMPKDTQHYAIFPEETVIQLNGLGPAAINYVNPADDPRKSN